MNALDRTGEPIDPDTPEDDHPYGCEDGWLGEDAQGRPRPCPVCRPHIPQGRKTLTRRVHGPEVR
jgi:hypothetical protein